jgi:hypothetical protein
VEQLSYQVDAVWDQDAAVWVATSDTVPGLVTEAETVEALSQKLRAMIPDLLFANKMISDDYEGAITFQLISHRQELFRLHLKMAASLTPTLKKMLVEAGCFLERQGKGDHEI